MRNPARSLIAAVTLAAAAVACGPTERTTAPVAPAPIGGPGESRAAPAVGTSRAESDPARTLPPGTTPAGTTAPGTTPPTSTAAAGTTAPGAVVDASSPAPVPDDVPSDDPSFDSEPLQALDFDVVVLPLDDAGVGGLLPVAVEPDGAPSTTAPGSGPARSDPEPDDAAIAVGGWAAFDAALEDALIRNGNTAAAVAVAIDGAVVHEAAFGVRVPGGVDPAEAGDRFRIASISKPITAITLLTLVADGTIGLDEPIGRRVADLLGLDSVSSGARQLTVRRLLSHTSGFGKFDTEFFRGGVDDCRAAAGRALRGAAGSGGYVYSNMNYCVAGLLIEALTGHGYERAAYERLLTPLGISGMRLPPTIDPGPDEVQHVTTPGRNYMETLAGAGAWIAAPGDLVRIMDALDPWLPGWKPLPTSLLSEVLRPTGGSVGQRGYGLGVIMYGPGRYGHTGTIENTRAMVQHRGDGVTWAVTVAGAYPDDTPRLEGIVNAAFVAAGFVAG